MKELHRIPVSRYQLVSLPFQRGLNLPIKSNLFREAVVDHSIFPTLRALLAYPYPNSYKVKCHMSKFDPHVSCASLSIILLATQAAEEVPFIMPEDTAKLHETGGCTFIDVREPPEWAESGMVTDALPVRINPYYCLSF